MRRIVCLVLVMAMLLALCACSNEKAALYCSACGTGLTEGAAFCNSCGTPVGGTGEAENEEKLNSTTISTITTKAKVTTTTAKPTAKPKATTVKPATTTKNTTTTKPKVATAKSTTQKAHTHSYSQKVTPASCTEKGYTTYTCSCGYSYKDNYTNPSHNYENYVCRSCGAVDKAHAYEYLELWVKKNGKTQNTHVSYTYSNDGVTYYLDYDAQHDGLSLSSLEYKNDAVVYSGLALDDYGYLVSIEDYELTELYGYITASEFTRESPITYTKYNGDANIKYTFIELSRLSIDRLLQWLDWMLKYEEVNITLSDLGFTAYQ